MGIDKKYNGCILEIDTDGLLLDKHPDINKVNDFIKEDAMLSFGIEECTLSMDIEEFERGFIHKMKNYILLAKDDHAEDGYKPIIHGAYFVSSRAPEVYDDAVKLIVEYVKHDNIKETDTRTAALDIKMRPLNDFVMNVRMSKNVKEYNVNTYQAVLEDNSPGGQRWQPITTEVVYTDSFSVSGNQIIGLAMQMARITGVMPDRGTMISYIIVKDTITGKKMYEFYNPNDETQIHRLNYDEYLKAINKLFDATKIATFEQTRNEEPWLEDLLD